MIVRFLHYHITLRVYHVIFFVGLARVWVDFNCVLARFNITF